MDEVFARAAQALGGLEVLVNAAGVGQPTSPQACTEADMDAMLAVHVKGTMLTNQAAFSAMKSGGGAMVNFGSRAGISGAAGAPAYATAKGAVLAWTRSAARAWGRYGIRVNAVVPMIETPMVAGYRQRYTPEQREVFESGVRRTIVLGGSLGDADRDLGPVVVFLAGEASRFITGLTLPVDGGDLVLT